MSKRLRLRANATLRRIQNIRCPSQFIPYKKERVNERLALFWVEGWQVEGCRLEG